MGNTITKNARPSEDHVDIMRAIESKPTRWECFE